MKKLFTIMLAIAVLLAASVSCSKDNINKNDLIGKWEMVGLSQYYDGEWHVRDEDYWGGGNPIIEITATQFVQSGYSINYTLEGNKMVFAQAIGEGGTSMTIVSLTKDTLILEYSYSDGQIDRITLKKV